jgi:mono/diheme cytochrome c family protein
VLTTLLIVALALLVVAYAALPLVGPKTFVDPLPDVRDPVLADLEEERDALLRAIRELEARDDLNQERRAELRTRYEKRAAQTLALLERTRGERSAWASTQPSAAEAGGAATEPRRTRRPFAALTLLAIAALSTSMLGSFVLPRVGQGAVTTFFEEELRVAEALRDLMRAADRDPSVANLMALGEAYWNLADAEGAERSYRAVIARAEADGATASAPLLSYKRLALLLLDRDIEASLELLKRARQVDPTDPETLFAIAELSFALGELDASEEAFSAYLATPEGAGDPDAVARLQLVQLVGPASSALAEERSAENLLALADAFWSSGAEEPAIDIYFEVLTQHDPLQPVALSRVGQLLFIRGMTSDAISLIEQAAGVSGGLRNLEPQATLFLGNAYTIAGDDAGAVRAWEAHLDQVGVDRGGRVVGMLDAARARLQGEDAPIAGVAPAPPTETQVSDRGELAAEALNDPFALERLGASLFAQHCAACHGAAGEGGAGVRLSGNSRAGDAALSRSVIVTGRGIMPAFSGVLLEDEIDVLVRWVAQNLAVPR